MAAKKATAPDYSKWSFTPLDDSGQPVQQQAPAAAAPTPSQAVATQIQQDVQGAPKAQPAAPPLPDMTAQDPHSFATLSANMAINNMRQQGATPLVEDFKKIYTDAYDKATDFRKTLVTQQAQQQTELAKQTILQKQQSQLEADRAVEITEREAPIKEEAAIRQRQIEEGGDPDAIQAAWRAAGHTGQAPLIKRMPDTELAKAAGFITGYQSVTDMHSAFNKMIQNAPGTGGVLHSAGLGLITQPWLTSPETRTFNSVLDSSLVPLARGVFGDTGATAGKDTIQAMMKESLPNATDNDQSGGQKVYMLKKRILDNLETQRKLMKSQNYNTAALDSSIADFHSDLSSMDQYNPLKGANAVVGTGISQQGNDHMNTTIAANLQKQQQQAAPAVTPTPTPSPTPAPTPQLPQQPSPAASPNFQPAYGQ